jgi:hypothetical protein
MVTLAKKAPNPTDKHVVSRVRMRRMMLSGVRDRSPNCQNALRVLG